MVILLIIYESLKLSFKLKFCQFRFINILKNTFINNKSFSALFLTLAGKIGVGSIAGVALAIYVGGIGTIFWMVIFTFFIVIIAYAEVYLGVKYRCTKSNEVACGPSYYMLQGLKNERLARIYSILLFITYTFGFTCIQSNTLGKIFSYIANYSLSTFAFFLSLLICLIISKGVKNIVNIINFIVPVMLILYVSLAIYLIIIHFSEIPFVIKNIISSALNIKPFFTGFIYQMLIGISRCEFASEAGIGTSAITSGITESNPKVQGYVQMFGIYITNILVCLSSAAIILLSPYQTLNLTNINGIEISVFAFAYHFGNVGIILLVIFIFLFSFSTILTCYFYSEMSIKFLFKKYKKYINYLKILLPFTVYLGMFIVPLKLWLIVDILVGILGTVNIFTICKLDEDVR